MANQNTQNQMGGGGRTPVPGRVARAFDFTTANDGNWGITPVPSPAPTPVPGGQADGRSPNAKRPLNPSTIAAAASVTRVMSVEDLSAAVHTLHTNAERYTTWTTSIAESVQWNAGLTDATGGRNPGCDQGRWCRW